jgi:hypothetical protein
MSNRNSRTIKFAIQFGKHRGNDIADARLGKAVSNREKHAPLLSCGGLPTPCAQSCYYIIQPCYGHRGWVCQVPADHKQLTALCAMDESFHLYVHVNSFLYRYIHIHTHDTHVYQYVLIVLVTWDARKKQDSISCATTGTHTDSQKEPT